MLQISHVSKRYGEKEALRDVSLQLSQGEIVGLFGENGAGKTTLMKCILGLLAYRGQILLDGRPIVKKAKPAWLSPQLSIPSFPI